MKKYWKAIVVVLAVFGLLGWFAYDAVQERAAMTATASATVTKVALDEDEESSSLDETDIEYSFEAAGKAVQAASSLPGDRTADYKPGQKIAICYDPADPTSSRIETDAAACRG